MAVCKNAGKKTLGKGDFFVVTLVQYAGFLLISKLDHIIKCKNLIYSLLIQYFETKGLFGNRLFC